MASKPCDIESFDEHGFAVFCPDDSRPDTERCHEYSVQSFCAAFKNQWSVILNEWDDSHTQSPEKLALIKQGVPAELRPALWTNLLEVESLQLCNSFHYQAELDQVREQLVELGISEFSGSNAVTQLCEAEEDNYQVRQGQVSMHALRHIILDLDRTYPTHKLYLNRIGEGREGRASLFRVLAAYARYNRSVEYCQGMSAIAGMFVMYLCEEDAFWCLVSLLERHKYLVGYFSVDMSRLRKHAEVFEKLLYQRLPDLQRHLDGHGIKPLMYITPWFLCLFTSLTCWDTVLAIWDLLLFDGYKTLFRVALAVMDTFKTELLSCDNMSDLLPQLLRLPPHVIKHSVLIPRVHAAVVEEWEINCLLSIVDEEERVAMEEEQMGGAMGVSKHQNLGVGTLPMTRGQKRKGSESSWSSLDGGIFQFRGHDARKSKRQKTDTDSSSKPSFLSRLRNIFSKRFSSGETDQTPLSRSHVAQTQSTIFSIEKAAPKGQQSPFNRKSLQRRSSRGRRQCNASVSGTPMSQSKPSVRSRRKSGRLESANNTPKGSTPLLMDIDMCSPKPLRLSEVKDSNTPVRRSPRFQPASGENKSNLNRFHFNLDQSQMFEFGAKKHNTAPVARLPLADNTNKHFQTAVASYKPHEALKTPLARRRAQPN